MDTKGTKQTEPSLSANDTTDTDDLEASLAKAMYEGNTAEVDRLMAVTEEKPEEKEEEENTEGDTESEESEEKEEKETPNEGETESEKDEGKTEAAAPAASTAEKPDDIETLKRELHQYKSDAGRVPYLQRRMTELERELRAAKARDVTPSQKATGTPSSKTKDVELDPETQKEIDELKEIDPALAKTLERIAKTAVATANERVEHAVNTMTQQEQEAEDFRFYTEQKTKLIEAVPQAEAIFATPEWAAWKERLTPNRRAMAESGYADEVIQAIYAFAADMRQANPASAAAAPAAVVTTPPETTPVTEARQRKVATSAEVPNPSAKKVETFDEEQAFREIYQNLAKKNHIL